MAAATAWIVTFDGDFRAALGAREMVHLVETPVLVDIPQTPSYCQQILIWEDEMLPVIDLTAWFSGRPANRDCASVAIVGWQEQPESPPQYGALLFTGIPQRVEVQDEQVCDLPELSTMRSWCDIAMSCFDHEGQPTPILDLPTLFSGALTTL